MTLKAGTDGKMRCFGSGNPVYERYHDTEWAVPVHDDQQLFEMLILECAQAGLSWETVLMKRAGYKRAFHNFDVKRVAAMSDAELEALREDASIIRNRLKIFAARKNAIAFLQIQKEFRSFAAYLWNWVGNASIVNNWATFSEVPITTEISDALSRDLKKRGMSFVGSTSIYAFMQSVGLVNDHVQGCWCRKS